MGRSRQAAGEADRHEPGSGTLDWQRRIDWLTADGYTGMVGLEHVPTVDTATSLKTIRGA